MSEINNKILRYGHVIRIQGDQFQHPKGLIVAKGFSKINNYRESLFQIWPKGSFEIHDEFHKSKRSNKNKDSQSTRMKTEFDQYLTFVDSKMDEEVLFGQEVIFKHLDSSYYFQGSYSCSEFSPDAFRVELVEKISSQALFKIKPYNTFQKDGQCIYYDEPLIMINEKQKYYLDFIIDKQVFVDQNLRSSYMRLDESQSQILTTQEILQEVVRKPHPDCHRHEMIITHNSKASWRFKLHENNQQRKDKTKIKPYDLIHLQFTHNGSYLSVDPLSNAITLRELKSKADQIPLEAVWELQPIQHQAEILTKTVITKQPKKLLPFTVQASQNLSPMMFEKDQSPRNNLENNKLQTSQAVAENIQIRKQQDFILRHYLTGKVLSVNDSVPELRHLMMDHGQMISISLAKQGDSELLWSSYVLIEHERTSLQMAEISSKNKSRQKSISVIDHETYFKRLNEDDLDYIKHDVHFVDKESIHAFQIIKVSDTTKNNMLFVLSSQEFLYQFVRILQYDEKDIIQEVDQKLLNRVIDILKKLLHYLQEDEKDLEKSDHQPMSVRQKCMKEVLMIELVMQILIYTTQKNLMLVESKDWKTERDKLKQVFKLSYLLIKTLTMNNQEIKLHVSQWLEVFLHQAMIIDEITVQASLSELLDDNYQAISKFITKESIQRVIDIMAQQVPHEKYLRILSSICVCKDRSVTNNQIYVLDLFYKGMSKGTFYQLLKKKIKEFGFEFKMVNNKVLIHCFINKEMPGWRSLIQFYQDSRDLDALQSWNYFLSYVNLLGDVCSSRNKYAQEYVQKNLPIDVLCSLVEDSIEDDTNVLESLLKVIHLAFVDNTIYHPIRLITKVKEWDTIESMNDIQRTWVEEANLPENTELIRVMNFIEQYVSTDQTRYNTTLLRVLMILKTTLQLGFWKSIDDLKRILVDMLRICSCRKDFEPQDEALTPAGDPNHSKIKRQKTKLTKMNTENQLMMNCKIIACEIISIVIELENNVRLNKMTQVFKRILEQVEHEHQEEIKLQSKEKTPQKIQRIVREQIQLLERKYAASPLHQKLSKYPKYTKLREMYLSQFYKYFPLKKEEKSLSKFKDIAGVFKKSKENKEIFKDENWVREVGKLIESRNLFTDLPTEIDCLELIFVEISLFQNPKMLELALQLCNKIYGQRRSLIHYFQQIILLSGSEKITLQLSRQSRVIRMKLLVLKELNLETKSSVVKDIEYLCSALKTDFIKNKGEQQPTGQQVFTECEENEKMHQSLFKAQNLQDPVIAFIKENEDQDLLLLERCYRFLTLLIWNHAVNKIEISWPLSKTYNHLKFDVCCCDFLKELFHNNKELLYNENEVTRLLKSTIREINNTSIESVYKAKLMDVLRVLQYDHNKTIKANQLLTLSYMQEKQNDKLMYRLKVGDDEKGNLWNENRFKNSMARYKEQYKLLLEQQGTEIKVDADLMYMSMYFEVFSLLVEDKNHINAEKCKAMHQYSFLVNLLNESIDFWPLQHFLRAYINRLYYKQNDFESISYFFTEYDLKCMIGQLSQIVFVKENYGELFKKVVVKDGIRFNYMFSYVYTSLQEILFTLNLVFVNEQYLLDLEEILEQHVNEQDYSVHISLFRVASLLSQVEKQWFKSKYVTDFCKVLVNIFKCIFKTFSPQDMQKIDSFIRRVKPRMQDDILMKRKSIVIGKKDFNISKTSIQPQQEPIEEDLITALIEYNEQACQMDQEQLKLVNLQQTLKKTLHLKWKRKQYDTISSDNNKELNIKHTKLVKMLFESKQYITFSEDEFNLLCEKLDQIDDVSQRMYKKSFPVITLKEFIRNIIQMNIHNHECLTDELKIFFLKVLVRMISEKNQKKNEDNLPIDQWPPDFWSDSRPQIEEEQNILDECGAASLIFQMFKDPFLDEKWALCSQLMIFTNAFLLGGNTKCQNSLLQRLKSDNNNNMLTNFQQLILKFSNFVVTNFKLRRSKKISKETYKPLISVAYLDNLDLFNESQETLNRVLPSAIESQETIMQKQMSIQVMCRAFRMLQLLCENNNVHMKNYLREQTDRDDVAHLNSINFVEFATKELRVYLKILNKDVISIPTQIVDFINEVIQLPCILNQNTLCKSTYIEDACFNSQYFSKESHQINRGFKTKSSKDEKEEDQEGMKQLFELESKIIQSILQVLEGNDQRNYEDLSSKLEMKFLINFIRQICQINSIKQPSDLPKLLVTSSMIFPEQLQMVLNVFIIKEKIEHMLPESKLIKHLKQGFDADDQMHEISKFCKENLKKIEIFYQNEYQMVFFLSHPVFGFLSDETRDKIMFTIPRETQREKLISILSFSQQIFSEIEYNYTLNQQRIPITHQTIQLLINIAQWLSLVINIIMVLSYAVVIKDKQSELQTDFYEHVCLTFFGMTQLLISLAAFIFYIISRAPLELKKLNKNDNTDLAELQNQFQVTNIIKFFLNQAGNVYQIMKSDDFLQYFIYITISFMGVFANTYYFSLHLFYLFNVFQAITHNATQLCMVAMLGVLFQFVFSIVGFNNYVDDIYPDDQPEDPCHSLLSCMITLMTSGVIGTSMSKWDPLKFMYDTVYFVFFALLFTNIISGIMIDTFAELRDKRQKIDDDKKNLCFICGIDRATLEKNQDNFDTHTNSIHFLWNYVFYVYCLRKKDSTEYSGLEYWIMEQVEKESTNWFPLVNVDQSGIEQNLDDLNKKLDTVVDLLKKGRPALPEQTTPMEE